MRHYRRRRIIGLQAQVGALSRCDPPPHTVSFTAGAGPVVACSVRRAKYDRNHYLAASSTSQRACGCEQQRETAQFMCTHSVKKQVKVSNFSITTACLHCASNDCSATPAATACLQLALCQQNARTLKMGARKRTIFQC